MKFSNPPPLFASPGPPGLPFLHPPVFKYQAQTVTATAYPLASLPPGQACPSRRLCIRMICLLMFDHLKIQVHQDLLSFPRLLSPTFKSLLTLIPGVLFQSDLPQLPYPWQELEGSGKNTGFGSRSLGSSAFATCCVALGKLPSLSGPLCSLQKRDSLPMSPNYYEDEIRLSNFLNGKT